MPLDLEEAKRDGLLRRVRRRQSANCDCAEAGHVNSDKNEGEAPSAEPFSIFCRIAELSELGPGIPLYFKFLKYVIGLLLLCLVLYAGVAANYWFSNRIDLASNYQRDWVEGEGLETGASLDEWQASWYTNNCGNMVQRLWSTPGAEDADSNISNISSGKWPSWPLDMLWKQALGPDYSKTILWLTAAVRGPWRGRSQNWYKAPFCPTLQVGDSCTLNSTTSEEPTTTTPEGALRDRTLGDEHLVPLRFLSEEVMIDCPGENESSPAISGRYVPCGYDKNQLPWWVLLDISDESAKIHEDHVLLYYLDEHWVLANFSAESQVLGTIDKMCKRGDVLQKEGKHALEEEDTWRDEAERLIGDGPQFTPTHFNLTIIEAVPSGSVGEFPTGSLWRRAQVELRETKINWRGPRSSRECGADLAVRDVRCSDVAVLCDGCEPSFLARWIESAKRIPKDADTLLVSFACLVTICITLPLLHWRTQIHAEALEGRTVSPRDYTVFVRGLPKTIKDLDEAEIAAFFKRTLDEERPKYADPCPNLRNGAHHVAHVTFVFGLRSAFTLFDKAERADLLSDRLGVIIHDYEKDEIEALKRKQEVSGVRQCLATIRLRYIQHLLHRAQRSQERAKRKKAKCLARLDLEHNSVRVCGALVTFEHKVAAQRALEAFRGSGWCDGCIWNREQRVPPRFKDRKIQVVRALDPSDIKWENLGKNRMVVGFYRFLGITIAMALMVGLSYMIWIMRRRGQTAKPENADLTKLLHIDLEALVHAAIGPAVVLTDIALREVLANSVVLECHASRNAETAAAMWKHTIASILNSALVCLIVHAETDETAATCEKNWYLQGGLVEDAVAISFANMIASPALLLLPPWGNSPVMSRVKRLVLDIKHSRMTQEELTEIFGGVEYRLGYRYATAFKTLFLTLLYAPLVPCVLPMGVIGLTLQYWADKTCLLRHARQPAHQTRDLGGHALNLLPLTLLPIPIMTVFMMRSTDISNFRYWYEPCIPWGMFIDDNESSVMPWRMFLLQIYILCPALACLLTLFALGGMMSLQYTYYTLRFIVKLTWRVTSLCTLFTLRLGAYILSCGRWDICRPPPPKEPEPLDDSDDGRTWVSLYSAQRVFTTKYHKNNPVYKLFPESVNPDILPRPGSGSGNGMGQRAAVLGVPNHPASLKLRNAWQELVSGSLVLATRLSARAWPGSKIVDVYSTVGILLGNFVSIGEEPNFVKSLWSTTSIFLEKPLEKAHEQNVDVWTAKANVTHLVATAEAGSDIMQVASIVDCHLSDFVKIGDEFHSVKGFPSTSEIQLEKELKFTYPRGAEVRTASCKKVAVSRQSAVPRSAQSFCEVFSSALRESKEGDSPVRRLSHSTNSRGSAPRDAFFPPAGVPEELEMWDDYDMRPAPSLAATSSIKAERLTVVRGRKSTAKRSEDVEMSMTVSQSMSSVLSHKE
eukprot:TRINITY_DN26587_c0_g1_i1.p1 TRINITY_DN26587_c0_g1~~TRINITY_DN26587_c0_g1_i1.p1  ORF type:complete len:1439 (-),score=305.85 TRINITY_DN26587_c0_g1_i1:574-4890(-)